MPAKDKREKIPGEPGMYRRGDVYLACVNYTDTFGKKRQRWVTAKTKREV